MKLDFLPNNILLALENVNLKEIIEIRLRRGQPIIIKSLEGRFFLSNSGLTILRDKAIICEKKNLEYILVQLTENSLYAYNDRLKNGYLTNQSGVRIGIAGECVFDNNQIVTIKNVSSINIRIPNFIKDSSKKILSYILSSKKINSLIISPPGFGKTTILKDLSIQLNNLFNKNILIIDERGEFNEIEGENIDIVKYSNKYYAFNYCIRSLSPNIVITDELISKDDWQCVQNAVNSGINIIASVHASCIEELVNKEFFINDLFDLYFVLENNEIPGRLKRVYDKNFEII